MRTARARTRIPSREKGRQMQIRKFSADRDLARLEDFLRRQYLRAHLAVSWLPARLHDLLYRVCAQEADEGRAISAEYIYLWEDAAGISACLLPDGENVYLSIRPGCESLLPAMLAFAEEHCLPLFARATDGSVKFWVAVSDSLGDLRQALVCAGYSKFPEEEHLNCILPQETEPSVTLPDGFRFRYGEEYPDEEAKWSALRLGFHPDWEAPGYRASLRPYLGRKQSAMFADSFECIVTDETAAEGNNVCAYAFVYVDRRTKTALIEPVSTRERYRHRGIGTALLHGAVLRCRARGVEKCYVISFGWRKDFYAAAGFRTEDSTGFWYKIL